MKFIEKDIKGVFEITLDRIKDDRGWFTRSWCSKEFNAQGLNSNVVQCNISYNNKRGTLRGMHYQEKPYKEAKLVRCCQGSIFDVVIDLRSDSATFKKWVCIELSSNERNMLYIPEGLAHGFQTLEDNTEILYQMSEYYNSECARGVRWNDPQFAIEWPIAEKIISLKDQQYPDYKK